MTDTEGEVVFSIEDPNEEIIRVMPDGSIFIRGVFSSDDAAIIGEAFIKWAKEYARRPHD